MPLLSNCYRPVSNPHRCFATWCQFCREFGERDHLCYQQSGESAVLRKLQRKSKDGEVPTIVQRPLIKNGKFQHCKFAYDLETSNSPSRYHEPTRAGVMCLDDDSFSQLFSGPRCVQEFIDWILKNVKNSTFICHNARGYDHIFVLKAMEQAGPGLHIDRLQDSSRISAITLKNNNCRFICSLSFLPQALSKLPHTLGIAHLVLKGMYRLVCVLDRIQMCLVLKPICLLFRVFSTQVQHA